MLGGGGDNGDIMKNENFERKLSATREANKKGVETGPSVSEARISEIMTATKEARENPEENNAQIAELRASIAEDNSQVNVKENSPAAEKIKETISSELHRINRAKREIEFQRNFEKNEKGLFSWREKVMGLGAMVGIPRAKKFKERLTRANESRQTAEQYVKDHNEIVSEYDRVLDEQHGITVDERGKYINKKNASVELRP